MPNHPSRLPSSTASPSPPAKPAPGCVVDGCTTLRREEAIAAAQAALAGLDRSSRDPDAVRKQARRFLEEQEGVRYCYEDPIEEIVEDLVWMLN